MSLEERLAERTTYIPHCGCRIWLGSTSMGYGTFRSDGKVLYVHREVLSAKEAPPFPGAHARHSCDIPCCCEESHLSWGTPKQNSEDAVRRGRLNRSPRTRGAEVNTAKLTAEDVLAIRSSLKSSPELASEYGVGPGTIWRIRTRKTWRHLQE